MNWIDLGHLPEPTRAQVKIRNKHNPAPMRPSSRLANAGRRGSLRRAAACRHAGSGGSVLSGRPSGWRRLDRVAFLRRFLEYLAFRAVLFSLRKTPLSFAHRLSHIYTKLLDRAIPRLRRASYQNLAMALPAADACAITDGVYRSLARMLVAFSRFPDLNRSNIHEWIRYDGFEHFLEAKRRGKGVLFATAHMGAWELSAFAHALMAQPMQVVVRPLDNRLIDMEVESRRAASGNTLIEKEEAARAIFRALQRNEAVGVLIDQNVMPHEGVFVDSWDFRVRGYCIRTNRAKDGRSSDSGLRLMVH